MDIIEIRTARPSAVCFCDSVSQLGAAVERFCGKCTGAYIVADRNVEPLARKAAESLPEGLLKGFLAMDFSEERKTLEGVSDILAFLLEGRADRRSLLISFGGGIASDMAGFAASIYMRGISCAYVATTLLAQTDAAIGGKTGVNFHGYKNMAGTFSQSVFTFICPEPLRTLPYRELLAGASEILKTFMIRNGGDAFARTVEFFSGLRGCDPSLPCPGLDTAVLGTLVREAAAVKADVVSKDEKEGGLRKVLNLGHTFAHAIEKLSGGTVGHGEAVSMGLVLAAGLRGPGLRAEVRDALERAGLKTACPYGVEEMAEAMSHDKKSSGGKVDFIVPVEIGRVEAMALDPSEIGNLF